MPIMVVSQTYLQVVLSQNYLQVGVPQTYLQVIHIHVDKLVL